MGATFVGLGRALVAAALAAIFLTATKAKLPARKDIPRFAIVGLGVVIGLVLAVLGLSHSPILRAFVRGYIGFARAIPTFVLLLT